MRRQMGCIDHQRIVLATLGRQRGKDAVEHFQTASTDKPIGDRLVRAVVRRRIAPAIAYNKDDAAYNPPVIDPGRPVRQWNYGASRRICVSDSHVKSLMTASPYAIIKSALAADATYSTGPDLNWPSSGVFLITAGYAPLTDQQRYSQLVAIVLHV